MHFSQKRHRIPAQHITLFPVHRQRQITLTNLASASLFSLGMSRARDIQSALFACASLPQPNVRFAVFPHSSVLTLLSLRAFVATSIATAVGKRGSAPQAVHHLQHLWPNLHHLHRSLCQQDYREQVCPLHLSNARNKASACCLWASLLCCAPKNEPASGLCTSLKVSCNVGGDTRGEEPCKPGLLLPNPTPREPTHLAHHESRAHR